jgi:hypothetical protein
MQLNKSIVILGSTLLLVAGGLAAQTFNMERQVIAPGGGHSSGDDWQLDGTIAQTAAGKAAGGSYTLDAGFWVPETATGPLPEAIFLDGFEGTP